MGLFLIPIFSIVRLSLSVMVEERQRRTAFSADSIIAEASFIIGPAAGVLLVTQAGADVALYAIGACEVLAGLIFLDLNPPTRSAPTRRTTRSGRRQPPRRRSSRCPWCSSSSSPAARWRR